MDGPVAERRRKKGVPEDRGAPPARPHPLEQLDLGEMHMVLTFTVVEAGGRVVGGAEFLVHQSAQDQADGLQQAILPEFHALIEAVARHLGLPVLEGELEAQAPYERLSERMQPETVVHGRTPGRA